MSKTATSLISKSRKFFSICRNEKKEIVAIYEYLLFSVYYEFLQLSILTDKLKFFRFQIYERGAKKNSLRLLYSLFILLHNIITKFKYYKFSSKNKC